MKTNSMRTVVLCVLSLAAAGLFATAATAAPPSWMPGFPLRAGSAVILMWSPVPGATEYKLLKKVGDAEFKEVYRGPLNTYNDTDAPATKTIEYKVSAVVGGKEDSPSSVASLRGIEAIKPPVFTGSMPSPDAITIRWSNPQGSMFFNLYRSEKRDGPYALLGSVQQDSYTDRKVEKRKTYFYKVTAVDRNNTESEKSTAQETRIEEVVVAVVETPVIKKPVPKGIFRGEDLYELVQPFDAGFNKDGELYVLDRTSIQFFDKDGKYLRRINFNEKWALSSSATLDRDGNFLLAFYSEKVIRKVDSQNGGLIWERRYPVPPGKENNPNHVVVDKDGNYWIADGVRFQLIKMDSEGNVLDNVGRLAGTYTVDSRKDTDLPTLSKVYVNPNDGNLYCVLGISSEIRVIDPKTGKMVKTMGGVGMRNGQFSGIGGISFRKNGNFLVLDHMLLQVKEFTKDFAYVATYADIEERGGKYFLSANLATGIAALDDYKRMYLISVLNNGVYLFDMPY